MIVREEDIGGATVRRLFNRIGDPVRVGMVLSREEVLRFPSSNRQSLIDGGYIAIFPPAPEVLAPPTAELHIVSRGFGKFDVIDGTKINGDPLESREEAEALVAAKKGQTQ